MFTFEEKISEIDNEIAKRKNKWQLKSLPHMDYSDVSQIIRLHVFNKWHLWDQSRPLVNWLNSIISNQICNLVESNYSILAPPCNSCPHNMGNNFCSYTFSGERSKECLLYEKWQKKKQPGYNIKLASSINHEDFVEKPSDLPCQIDYDLCMNRIHLLIKPKLTDSEYKIYKLMVVEGLDEIQIAKKMGFRTSEKGRKPGYKRIKIMKNLFIKLTKEIISAEDILSYGN